MCWIISTDFILTRIPDKTYSEDLMNKTLITAHNGADGAYAFVGRGIVVEATDDACVELVLAEGCRHPRADSYASPQLLLHLEGEGGYGEG
jgi:hypothetical protein